MRQTIIFIISLALAVGITALIFPKNRISQDNKQKPKNYDLEEACRQVQVRGASMEPTLKEGQIVCAYVEKPQAGDLAVFKCKDCGLAEAIKRVVEIKEGCYRLLGDNPKHSLDSREFGFLCPEDLEYIWKAKQP